MMGNSLGASALQGLGIGQLDTGILRMSRLPIQKAPGAPSPDPEDVDSFLEVPDDGMYDDMMADDQMDDDDYGAYPRVQKSRFIETYSPTSAQPLAPRGVPPDGGMGGGMDALLGGQVPGGGAPMAQGLRGPGMAARRGLGF